MNPIMKNHPLLKIANSALVDLPSPSNISAWWNFGSLLGICLSLQLATGVFLAMHYGTSTMIAFESVNHLAQDVPNGWLLRMCHANGASMFFFCLYFHVARGMYFSSYSLHMVWSVGVSILLLVMAAAFLGYVLPWGQMSFWGTTVITNLLSAIPYVGQDIVIWLWGGFAVGNPTLTRFFAFHFLVPFIVMALSLTHLLFLHQTGSNNPLGASSNFDKSPFQPYFTWKDLAGMLLLTSLLSFLVLQAPWLLGDPENFIPANPMVTPVHIQPEWYFLFAYAILRSIPNKLGGVVALGMAVMVLFTMPLISQTKFNSMAWYPFNQILFWTFVGNAILLTWVGARPVEEPYVATGQILSILYFSYFPALAMLFNIQDNLLN